MSPIKHLYLCHAVFVILAAGHFWHSRKAVCETQRKTYKRHNRESQCSSFPHSDCLWEDVLEDPVQLEFILMWTHNGCEWGYIQHIKPCLINIYFSSQMVDLRSSFPWWSTLIKKISLENNKQEESLKKKQGKVRRHIPIWRASIVREKNRFIIISFNSRTEWYFL